MTQQVPVLASIPFQDGADATTTSPLALEAGKYFESAQGRVRCPTGLAGRATQLTHDPAGPFFP